ncbi:trypsin-like serine protease [Agaribacterium haliotis]|uniref:trypsin-like serine protease n=1 Tax=Agaribacterium haliotis TaxID=2013869 RepID=UPI000BB59116|nr:trypsin-like serine protease [Agaribacterium haliotis]
MKFVKHLVSACSSLSAMAGTAAMFSLAFSAVSFAESLEPENVVPFVVGGQDALRGEYPWQVLITSGVRCGGTIIDKRWVLTAAHCTDGTAASEWTVYAGAHDRSRVNSDSRVQAVRVKRIVEHPQWNNYTLQHDMALLELSSDLEFNSAVQAIELADSRPAINEPVYVSGWGETNSSPGTTILQEGRLQVVSQNACANALRDVNSVSADMLCAGFENGAIGGCYGDSGGPLVYQSRTRSGFVNGWRLAGVVSWGRPGCTSYTVFSDVSAQASDNGWIKTTIGDGSDGGSGSDDIYGDINRDGCIDGDDYDLYVLNRGRTGSAIQPKEADINGDGRVNYGDYYILAVNWGAGCSAN